MQCNQKCCSGGGVGMELKGCRQSETKPIKLRRIAQHVERSLGIFGFLGQCIRRWTGRLSWTGLYGCLFDSHSPLCHLPPSVDPKPAKGTARSSYSFGCTRTINGRDEPDRIARQANKQANRHTDGQMHKHTKFVLSCAIRFTIGLGCRVSSFKFRNMMRPYICF